MKNFIPTPQILLASAALLAAQGSMAASLSGSPVDSGEGVDSFDESVGVIPGQIRLSYNTASEVSAACSVSGEIIASSNNAVEGTDFTLSTNTFSFSLPDNPNFGAEISAFEQVTFDYSIAVVDDDLVEGSERVDLTLSNVITDCDFDDADELDTTINSAFQITDNDTAEVIPEVPEAPAAEGTGDLASRPGLTAQQIAIAKSLDASCSAPAVVLEPVVDGGGLGKASSTVQSAAKATPKAQAELQQVCDQLQVSTKLGADLEALSHGQYFAQGRIALQSALLQTQNVSEQIRRLREGTSTVDLSGINLTIDGQTIAGSQLNTLLGAGAGDEQIHSPWGVFVGGGIEVGERKEDDSEAQFDFSINNLIVGVDYQLSDTALVGSAIGYNRSNADIDNNGGESDMSGVSLSVFGSLYQNNNYYVDGIVSYGRSQYDSERFVSTLNQTAVSETDGSELSASLNGGYYFTWPTYYVRVFGALNYVDASIDGFDETLNGSNFGALLVVGDQDIESLTSNFGAEFGWNINTQSAVITPSLSLDWEHQFKDDVRSISGRFIGDASNTLFTVESQVPDANYFNAAVGVSAVFKGGMTAFVNYETDLARDEIDLYTLNFGFRWEL